VALACSAKLAIRASTASVLLAWAANAPAAPPEAFAQVLLDARTVYAQDKETAYFTRYLDLTHKSDEDFTFYRTVLTLHVNLLSREALIVAPRQVGKILALDLRDYGIDAKVWERLINREPYYHQQKEYVEQTPRYGTDAYGRQVVTGHDQKKAVKIAAADFIPQPQAKELYALTQSQVPVVLGDWFFVQTSVEADRGGIGKGFGYYDFLGLKNRDDFFKLVGFDEKDRRSIVSEIGAVVMGHNSGVAQNDRMVVRRGAVDGFLYFTIDFFENNLDEQNPLAILDRDKGLKHQAERHFGVLPNGLPAMLACNDKGVLQDTAPDKIGPDHTASGNDKRIHPSKSCVSCHSNGFLKPITDEVRQIYSVDRERGYNLLASPSKEEQLKLSRIYLRNLNQKLEDDRKAYTRAVKECNGQDVAAACADYRDAYERYVLKSLDIEAIAAGLGVTVPHLQARLKTYRSADKLTAHNLAPLSVGRPITRGNYEQLFPLLMAVARGGIVQ
jgi:hypothetical protein